MNANRILGLAILCALAIPSASQAYYVETRGVSGAEVPLNFADTDESSAETIDVNFRINTSSFPAGSNAADFTTAIQNGFATWTAADCATLTFNDDGTSESVNPGHWAEDDVDSSGNIEPAEAHVLVYFDDSDGEWPGGPAVGHFYFATNTEGVQIGATVVLNSRDHEWATDGSPAALDLQGTVTALIGRSLGISSNMEGNSTFPRYSAGTDDKRTLGADDLAAIQFLYLSGDGACAAPEAPEMQCLATTPDCPPPVSTNPGDAGTANPDAGARTDAGPVPGTDAGTDAGPRDPMGDGGCSCRATNRGHDAAGFAMLALALGLLVARRRRGV